MSSSVVAIGPVEFGSGVTLHPTAIDGRQTISNIVEHDVPGREGGIIEYMGSKQPTMRLQGILTAYGDTGPACYCSSGQSTIALNADEAKNILVGLRGSGAHLLRVESTYNYSGPIVNYENDFFYITSLSFGFEPSVAYPYYPFTVDLLRASPRTFGNGSGISSTFPDASGVYFSGYIRSWQMAAKSGTPDGKSINSIGVYLPTAASGFLQMAVYSGLNPGNATMVACTEPRAITSGWNYFSLNPNFVSESGYGYILSLMGSAANSSGFTVGIEDNSSATDSSFESPCPFSSGFVPILRSGVNVSGIHYAIKLVTA